MNTLELGKPFLDPRLELIGLEHLLWSDGSVGAEQREDPIGAGFPFDHSRIPGPMQAVRLVVLIAVMDPLARTAPRTVTEVLAMRLQA